MSILPRNTDFTSKDFDALHTRMESLLRSLFPTWTDHEVINFGNLLVGLYCFFGDILCFNQDNNARESRLTTATQRRNVLALVKLLNYTPGLAEAATADELFTGVGLTANVDIPAGQIFKTPSANAIAFQLLSPVHLTPGSPSAVGTVENTTTEDQIYSATGEADQKIALDETPFLKVVSVIGASSGEWLQVDNFSLSGSGDKVFAIMVDNSDKATITFGNGVSGAMPSDDLTITYKTGGGAVGNVAAGSITIVDSQILDVDGNPVTVTVTNPSAAAGGVDRETIASIKARAPVSIHNPTSTIARTDYEDNALTFVDGLTRALMLTRNQDPTIPENAGRLYLVPAGDASSPPSPGFPSAKILQAARAVFVSDTRGRSLRPAPSTFALQTLGATYLDFTITARVYLTKAAAATSTTKTAVKTAVRQSLIDYFNPVLADGTRNPKIDFGFYLRQLNATTTSLGQIVLSDLEDAVRDVDGIRKLGSAESDFLIDTSTEEPDLTVTSIGVGVHGDIDLEDSWFPRFASITLIDGDTGATL